MPRHKKGSRRAFLVRHVPAVLMMLAGVGHAHADDATHWVGAWSAAMLRAPSPANAVTGPQRTLSLSHQTLRGLVRVGLRGTQLRIVLDNRFGKAPVTIDAASIGRHDVGAALLPGSIKTLTFDGRHGVTMAPGSIARSDALTMDVHAGELLGISLYVSGKTQAQTLHPDPPISQYLSGPGNRTQSPAMRDANQIPALPWLARVDVQAPAVAQAIVALGDSITNGYQASALTDWPDVLQDRLDTARCRRAVLNAGIDGNQVTAARGTFGQGQPMRDRLANDVLAVPGATYLVVMGGINDIGLSTLWAHKHGQSTPSAQALADPVIDRLKKILADAHARGMRVYGATLTPMQGLTRTYSPQGEAARAQVNAWIRGPAGYDGVIDFDKALRDPAHPRRLRQAYDSGDSLHPSDAGYRAMADAVPLGLFDCR